MEDESKEGDQFDLNKFPVKEDDDHPDHQIDRNVDEDSLKNKEETENKTLNADVTGGGMTSRGESSSARDDLSNQRKRQRSPLTVHNPDPLLGYIQGIDGGIVPVYYSETMISTPSSHDSVFSQNVNSLSIDPYMDMGLTTTDFNSDDKLTGVIVGPIVHRMITVFITAPIHGGRIGETRARGRYVSDQQGGSILIDPKKAKK